MAFWANLVARALRAAQLGEGTNSELLGTLEADSAMLSCISEEFIELDAKIQIRTFYETEEMACMNSLVRPTRYVTSPVLRLPLDCHARLSAFEFTQRETSCPYSSESSNDVQVCRCKQSTLSTSARGTE